MIGDEVNTNKRKVKPVVREFHLADWFTLLNVIIGTSALFFAMNFYKSGKTNYFDLSCLFLILSLIFDIVDGKVARWRQTSSAFGRELDSLSDIVSFGVAPVAIAYSLGINTILDTVVFVLFVGCGVLRLARYNVLSERADRNSETIRDFEGFPIPTSLLLVALLWVLASYFPESVVLNTFSIIGVELHWISLLFSFLAIGMVSRIRVPKI